MNPIVGDLRKLRALVDDHWQIDSLKVQSLSSSAWRTTVGLTRGGRELTLQSDDRELFDFCIVLRPSLDGDGAPKYRRVKDLNRYYAELEDLTADSEGKRKEAVRRSAAGLRLGFTPESLIAEFLKSREWGDARFLPLKTHHFDVQASVLLSSREAVDSQKRVQQRFPLSAAYARRIGDLLLGAFPPTGESVKGYPRFADASKTSVGEIAKRLIEESRYSDDTLARLSRDGSVRGDIGLRHLIDIYRRYADWVRPALRVLCDAVNATEGKPSPDPNLGLSRGVELIRRSRYSDIVDCFDLRIRHAASHNEVSCDHERSVVRFAGIDGCGTRVFDDFELSYTQVSDRTRDFTQGFIPGTFIALGMHQQAHLLATVASGET